MPCRTDWPEETTTKQNREALKLKGEADKLTKLLCTTLEWMERSEASLFNKFLSKYKAVDTWWTKHKKFDLARLASEKLSIDERKALLDYIKKNKRLP